MTLYQSCKIMKQIKLKPKELDYLKSFTRSGKKNVREVNRAYILLLLDKGRKSDEIEDFLEVERTAIWRAKKKYLEKGVKYAIKDNKRSGQPQKYRQKEKVEIIALACSDPPKGREKWTLELLTKESRKKEGLETINRESIRLILKKTNVNLG